MDERIGHLLGWLAGESTDAADTLAGWATSTGLSRRELLRAMINIRPARPVPAEMLALEASLLADELALRGVVDADSLRPIADDDRLALWQGDITRLRVDAIVNAANAQLLGCFAPLHRCIDNAIGTAAGMGLRQELASIMAERGRPEPTGTAALTGGHCLPASHVLHTVGPIIRGPLRPVDADLLASCYRSCLAAAAASGLVSVAFCCISTGEFGYPQAEAADTAIATVRAELAHHPTIERVIFNVFTDTDHAIYRRLLGPDALHDV